MWKVFIYVDANSATNEEVINYSNLQVNVNDRVFRFQSGGAMPRIVAAGHVKSVEGDVCEVEYDYILQNTPDIAFDEGPGLDVESNSAGLYEFQGDYEQLELAWTAYAIHVDKAPQDFNKKNLIMILKAQPDIPDPYSYDGSYELVQTVIKLYKALPSLEQVGPKDLLLIYQSASIRPLDSLFSPSKTTFMQRLVNDSQLPNNALNDVLKRIRDDAANRGLKNIGMFTAAIPSFERPQNKITGRNVQDFIKTCIAILQAKSDSKAIGHVIALSKRIVEQTKQDLGWKGMSTAVAAQIWHCLRPTAFPISNGAAGKIYSYLDNGIITQSASTIADYVDNIKKIEKLRDGLALPKNYRAIDLVEQKFNPFTDKYPRKITHSRKFKNQGAVAMTDTNNLQSNASMVPTVKPKIPLNQIFYGAPGTGKTYNAPQEALRIVNMNNPAVDVDTMSRVDIMAEYQKYIKSGRVVFTTFHQNYGYEDFIEGLRPDVNANNELIFTPHKGVFKSLAENARNGDGNYVIIIDEINRANISKVFGELITLIEEDKRIDVGNVNEMTVTLPSGEKDFGVPGNLYIIGTMNSADKSISLLDVALRRRFTFKEFAPDLALVDDPVLHDVLECINDILMKELKSTDLLIGHSFFINQTVNNLASILNEQIIPLLYEYFNDDRDKVNKVINEVINKSNNTIQLVSTNYGRIAVKYVK